MSDEEATKLDGGAVDPVRTYAGERPPADNGGVKTEEAPAAEAEVIATPAEQAPTEEPK